MSDYKIETQNKSNQKKISSKKFKRNKSRKNQSSNYFSKQTHPSQNFHEYENTNQRDQEMILEDDEQRIQDEDKQTNSDQENMNSDDGQINSDEYQDNVQDQDDYDDDQSNDQNDDQDSDQDCYQDCDQDKDSNYEKGNDKNDDQACNQDSDQDSDQDCDQNYDEDFDQNLDHDDESNYDQDNDQNDDLDRDQDCDQDNDQNDDQYEDQDQNEEENTNSKKEKKIQYFPGYSLKRLLNQNNPEYVNIMREHEDNPEMIELKEQLVRYKKSQSQKYKEIIINFDQDYLDEWKHTQKQIEDFINYKYFKYKVKKNDQAKILYCKNEYNKYSKLVNYEKEFDDNDIIEYYFQKCLKNSKSIKKILLKYYSKQSLNKSKKNKNYKQKQLIQCLDKEIKYFENKNKEIKDIHQQIFSLENQIKLNLELSILNKQMNSVFNQFDKLKDINKKERALYFRSGLIYHAKQYNKKQNNNAPIQKLLKQFGIEKRVWKGMLKQQQRYYKQILPSFEKIKSKTNTVLKKLMGTVGNLQVLTNIY